MNANQKKMDELFKQYEAIRLLAESEGRDLTAKDRENRTKIKAEIDRLCAIDDGDAEEKELRTRLYGDPNENRSLTLETGDIRQVGPNGIYEARNDKVIRGRDYRSLFGNPGIGKDAPLDRGGFKNFNEFLAIVHSGRSDNRLRIMDTRAMTIGGGGDSGGFSVPEEFSAWLLDSSLEGEIVRPRATVWPMISLTKKCPGWDASTHNAGLFGLTGTWMAESGSATEVFAKMRQITLNANKLACYTSASNELVADGISFEQQLSDAIVKTIGWYLDYGFIQGLGAGWPLGILNSPSLITVAKETGQIANTILYHNIVKMYARLAPQCMKNAVWIANQTTIPAMLTMTITVGTGGAFIPAVVQSNGKFYLLGKEVLFTEKCPALSSKGDIILADLSEYTIGLRKDVSLDKSNAPGWLKDESSYRAIVRADGQAKWNAPISPKTGDTLSWAVTLAAR
ncbi:MAG: phage major capsid protein [Proteobacteria bacterium]|nr:phage major capsid protein [Pseudomonadota bacterium]